MVLIQLIILLLVVEHQVDGLMELKKVLAVEVLVVFVPITLQVLYQAQMVYRFPYKHILLL
jgi:hypothetical protein